MVACNEDERIRRVKLRDNKSEEEIRLYLKKQPSQDDVIKKADVVIYNEGNPNDLKQHVDFYVEKFEKLFISKKLKL